MFWKTFDKLLDGFLALIVAFALGIILVNIGLRFFGSPLIWAEELARYLFVWMVFLGAAVAARKHEHIVVDLLSARLQGHLKRHLETLTTLVASGFLLVLAIVSAQFALNNLDVSAYTLPMMSLGIVQATIPLGCGLIIVNSIRGMRVRRTRVLPGSPPCS